ncbi:MAG: argininosuccinate lyase [Bacteroidales bacterium]|nr:argininosuccinate lyase [Bacteroidales bacterium]
MKLWDKGIRTDGTVMGFTAGRDRKLDSRLAVWDITASMAHAVMLCDAGLITTAEKEILHEALTSLLNSAGKGKLEPGDGFEDIHSRIEADLVNMTGDAGAKIHTGRSRNDQVLTDIYLMLRFEVSTISQETMKLLRSMVAQSDRYSDIMMPGYTHLQPAMPSTFGLWFGSFAESLCDDIEMLAFAFSAVNASPAGTAAGYGTTLPLSRERMAGLLQFDRLVINSAYSQLRRGKAEKTVADAIASLAFTLSRFAGDACLFMTREFSFIGIDDSLTTGSSIMPQKKNPDVFEIIRARANVLRSLPNTLSLMVSNLPSGYSRDFQVIKEVLFPALDEIRSLISMTGFMLEGVTVRTDIIDARYNDIFSAEAANRLVLKGVPFREAYRTIASRVGKTGFEQTSPADYTHLGSPGNTGNTEIMKRAASIMENIKALPANELASLIREA